ncbi:MAG: hypothetical protein ISS36_01315 [Candidatus Aenigmarchaeota archaeon]|nr:hypothetical protein [Candidatus Aenigmarchaeota archaeon]
MKHLLLIAIVVIINYPLLDALLENDRNIKWKWERQRKPMIFPGMEKLNSAVIFVARIFIFIFFSILFFLFDMKIYNMIF